MRRVVARAAPAVRPAAMPLSYAERNNPDKLSGQALRDIAHQLGLSWSEMQTMSEPKIREQAKRLSFLRYAEG